MQDTRHRSLDTRHKTQDTRLEDEDSDRRPSSVVRRPKNHLIVICGPTAVGKTRVAIDIAKHYHAEIISADSRQFYREMNIGTAKPSKQELREVKHHFVNNI